MKHFLDLEHLSKRDARAILERAAYFKAERGLKATRPLAGQTWALIFSKSSTRTRVSFEVGIRELGADCLFLNANDIQLGRGEPIKDTARVLGRMIHGAVIRTFAQQDVVDFATYSKIPTINALTDDEHPCQILADILTYEEKRGPITGKTVAFIGDAACNVPRSWAYATRLFDFTLVCAAPPAFACGVTLPGVRNVVDPQEAAKGADLLYTDVWVSMGKEDEAELRMREFKGYQINAELLALAKPGALVLHCLPAYRGKEITEEVMEERALDIFDEAENRLHVQKAIMEWCVCG
jgi:ornithine carbamoyltransferase